jgi:hypothetical protein
MRDRTKQYDPDREPPKPLKQVLAEKGLITRSQMRKQPRAEQTNFKLVEVPWGTGIVRAYKPPKAPTEVKPAAKKSLLRRKKADA